MSKPNASENFMKLAEVVSEMSIDPHTKFGCVAVSEDGMQLSTGYNSPPNGVDDSLVPLTRPEKYMYLEHAERNCIYNAASKGIRLKGCTFYVTGVPCVECLRAMYQVGAKIIIYKAKKAKSFDDSVYDLMCFLDPYIKIYPYGFE